MVKSPLDEFSICLFKFPFSNIQGTSRSSSLDSYSDHLSFLSDIDLVHELEENRFELFFFLKSYQDLKKERPTLSPQIVLEAQQSVAALNERINLTKKEIDRRDSVIESLAKSRIRRVVPSVVQENSN